MLAAEFTEVESGRKVHRPQLARAIVEARAVGAVLVIAKFDRLARNVAFLSALMNGDVEFLALDLPGASRFHLHIMAAVAEKEASDASERTRAALRVAKARGVKLGRPANLTDESRRRSIASRRARAAERHRLTLPLVLAWHQAGWTLEKIADQLTALRVELPRGGTRWASAQVYRVLRLARPQPTPARAGPAGASIRPTVFSLGYAGVAIDAFCQFVEAQNVRVVDVRHRPLSRIPGYNRKVLRARLGARYVHVPALGNRNYKGGPIALVDLEAGLAQVRTLLTLGPVALLCACADAQTCHRTVVADRLAAEGFPIVHATLQAPPPRRSSAAEIA